VIRLRDETSAKSEARALLVGLLQMVDRLPRSAVQRRRVWSALTRPARPSAWSQRSVRLVLASALLATAASASIAHYWPEPALIPPPPATAKSAPAIAVSLPKIARSEPAPPAPDPEAVVAEPAKARKTQRAQPSRADLEATLMLEALRTRNSGDAERVGKLAEEYQRKHPHGPLQEEALALALEAATARRDPSAARLARDYLRRYPNGRFQAQAARVLRDAR
jgi:hypothetical protein